MEGIFLKKINKTLSIGLLIVAITLLLKHVVQLPEFICGLGYGTGIAFELIGAYSINHDISKLKNFKSSFLKKCWNR